MDIRKRLNKVAERLTDDQEGEIDVVNTLMLIMFGRESENLPKIFTVECFMDQDTLDTFLREDLCLDVKSIYLHTGSIFFGKPRYEIELE